MHEVVEKERNSDVFAKKYIKWSKRIKKRNCEKKELSILWDMCRNLMNFLKFVKNYAKKCFLGEIRQQHAKMTLFTKKSPR